MTRKDYQLIAKTISDFRYEGTAFRDPVMIALIDRLGARICEALENENPRFNADKFPEAMEYGKRPTTDEIVMRAWGS